MRGTLLALVASSTVLGAATVACEPSCSDLLACGEQGPVVSTASGGASSVTTTTAASSGGAGGTGGAGGQVGDLGTQVAVGVDFACALSLGELKCWGKNDAGQLGIGSVQDEVLVATAVNLPGHVLEVSAGGSHACARLADGSVWCWGQNTSGQLGNGSFSLSRSPVEVALPSPATQVVASIFSVHVLHDDGSVSGWGSGTEIGDGSEAGEHSPIPTAVPIDSVLKLQQRNCAVRTNGSIWCWKIPPTYEPVDLGNSGTTYSEVAHNPDVPRTCAISSTSVQCRGSNYCAGAGTGNDTAAFYDNFVSLNALSGAEASQISCSNTFCLALAPSGVFFWGTLLSAQCEDDGIHDAYEPTALSFSQGSVVEIDTGGDQACLRTASGQVFCWGSNTYGALGTGDKVDLATPQTPVSGL